MARPTKPKEIKPKMDVKTSTEGGTGAVASSGVSISKLIIVNTVITVIICAFFVISNYFVVQNTVASSIKQMSEQLGGSEESSGEETDKVERGIILDLGEFILNLSDPKARRYLKVNVAIELNRLETDPVAGGGGGGHGGEAADPLKAIEAEMAQFKPAIRDSIISTLSSKTAEELSSVAGKELAKEQIKEAVDSIFAGEREVLRVSFGNFIIQ